MTQGPGPGHNPYEPPQGYVGQGAPPGVPYGQSKPKGFTFMVVTTMVLGTLGVLAGIWAPINLVFQKNVQSMMPTGSGVPEIESFQQEIMAAAMPEMMAGVGILNLITGAFALWAAFRLNSVKPGARRSFVQASTAVGIYEIIALLATGVVQYRSYAVMQRLATQMSSGAGAPTDVVGAVMGTAMVVGVLFAFVWGSAKIAFAFWARHHASKQEIVAFAGE